MIVKSVVEKSMQDPEDKTQKQVEITFQTSGQNNPVSKTITLIGDGSIKVLMPVY